PSFKRNRSVLYELPKEGGMSRRKRFEPLAVGSVGDDRIERVLVKDDGQQEIRFSWWPNGRFNRNPLVITESELLPLMSEAIRSRVVSDQFLRDLRTSLDRVVWPSPYSSSPVRGRWRVRTCPLQRAARRWKHATEGWTTFCKLKRFA